MKSEKLSSMIVCAAATTILCFTSCSRSHKDPSEVNKDVATPKPTSDSCSNSQKAQPEVSNEIVTTSEASPDSSSSLLPGPSGLYGEINATPGSSSDTGSGLAALRADGKPDIRKVDWGAFYQSVLKKHGVDDFSTGSLVSLMDSNIPSVRGFSALLLGHRQERSAIPRLERALNDEFVLVQAMVTKALLQMGNRKGVKVLEDFCEKASKEFEQGNYKNTAYMSQATRVLAEAGEVSAIPYLRQLLHYEQSWGTRLIAVRSLTKLYEKEPAVLTDIASKLQDENDQIRREVSEIMQNIQSKPSVPSGQQRK